MFATPNAIGTHERDKMLWESAEDLVSWCHYAKTLIYVSLHIRALVLASSCQGGLV